jgi:hypothetical protein
VTAELQDADRAAVTARSRQLKRAFRLTDGATQPASRATNPRLDRDEVARAAVYVDPRPARRRKAAVEPAEPGRVSKPMAVVRAGRVLPDLEGAATRGARDKLCLHVPAADAEHIGGVLDVRRRVPGRDGHGQGRRGGAPLRAAAANQEAQR